jgi:beta-1,4-mannosyl-glycoprotein beta-1,4-N-acetylglucosaminyltransferase
MARIFDCFTFFNELEILDIRLNTLNDYVDYFVLVEATKTHSGKEKELYYLKNKEKFKKFEDKIIHVIVDDMPERKEGQDEVSYRWQLENFQRNAIMRGLKNCKDDDIIIISDADEIPNPKKFEEIKEKLSKKSEFVKKIVKNFVKLFKLAKEIRDKKRTKIKKLLMIPFVFTFIQYPVVVFEHKLYYYFLNGFTNRKWIGSTGIFYKDLIEIFNGEPQLIRDIAIILHSNNQLYIDFLEHFYDVIKDGGWHFTYLGDEKNIKEKINSIVEGIFVKDKFTEEKIKELIKDGRFFDNSKLQFVEIDETFPDYVRKNKEKFKHLIREK